jgi:hypothetical protein
MTEGVDTGVERGVHTVRRARHCALLGFEKGGGPRWRL